MSAEEFLVAVLKEWQKIGDDALNRRQWQFDGPLTLSFTSTVIEQVLSFYENEHRLGQRTPAEAARLVFDNCLRIYNLNRLNLN